MAVITSPIYPILSSMFPGMFSTSRLSFERFCRRNISAKEVYDVISTDSPTIVEETKYLPWNPARTVHEAEERIDNFQTQWEDRSRAEWLIREEDGTDELPFIGSTGIICQWEKDLALFAIWLRKPYWGQGYSGERADALLKIAFELLDFDVVGIPLHSENTKSYNAVGKYVERHGGRYEGVLRNHAGRYEEPADHHRFTISQKEYRSADGVETTVTLKEN